MIPGKTSWAVALALTICAAVGSPGCAGGPSGEEVKPLPTVRGGERLYTETRPSDTLEEVVDPEFHMAAARRDYLAGITGASAREMEKVAAFLGYEANRTTGERRRAIEESQREIASLSREVARGKIESVNQIDQAFARARAALRW
jgi:hypothetical protein